MASTAPGSTLLQFQPLSSVAQPDFWHAFTSLKIERLRLDEDKVPLRGSFAAGRQVRDHSQQAETVVHLPPSLTVEGDAFASAASGSSATAPTSTGQVRAVADGYIKNYNTVEDFKKADKAALFDELARELVRSFISSNDPEAAVTRFLVLAFADLKKYKFYHWFAFPAPIVQPGWQIEEALAGGWASAEAALGAEALRSIAKQLPGFAAQGLRSYKGKERESDPGYVFRGAFLVKPSAEGTELGAVREYDTFFADVPESERIVALLDPSSHPQQPGWPLRNLLLLLRLRFKVRRIRVLRWLDDASLASASGATNSRSLIGTVFQEEGGPEPQNGWAKAGSEVLPIPRALSGAMQETPLATGWERNAAGKLAPKLSDLGPLMDPTRLADQAVDLNLKLMRWRIMPEIQLDKIASTRCLLFGAGTLGCYVARTLMGWGVRHITFVDNAKVSFSNPVRQPLFTFDDCLQGGEDKAPCAAARLKEIYPGMRAEGHSLAVPMPGHPVADSVRAQTERDLAKIEKLVDEHDVIFLLMDSRESRWLPSLLGAAKGKLVLNAALGFDTYLVMRHGAPPDEEQQAQAEQAAAKGETQVPIATRLGCYFCNDIVAPSDSLVDRTLDQMCTVTRPGLAAIAGASAVELMVSVLQHVDGVRAPGGTAQPLGTSDYKSGSCLGLLPHQIRGFLAGFSNMLIVGQAYDRCTACSARVVREYRARGHEMLLRAFNEDKYLEQLTGLDKMYEETDLLEAELEVDWDEEEE